MKKRKRGLERRPIYIGSRPGPVRFCLANSVTHPEICWVRHRSESARLMMAFNQMPKFPAAPRFTPILVTIDSSIVLKVGSEHRFDFFAYTSSSL